MSTKNLPTTYVVVTPKGVIIPQGTILTNLTPERARLMIGRTLRLVGNHDDRFVVIGRITRPHGAQITIVGPVPQQLRKHLALLGSNAAERALTARSARDAKDDEAEALAKERSRQADEKHAREGGGSSKRENPDGLPLYEALRLYGKNEEYMAELRHLREMARPIRGAVGGLALAQRRDAEKYYRQEERVERFVWRAKLQFLAHFRDEPIKLILAGYPDNDPYSLRRVSDQLWRHHPQPIIDQANGDVFKFGRAIFRRVRVFTVAEWTAHASANAVRGETTHRAPSVSGPINSEGVVAPTSPQAELSSPSSAESDETPPIPVVEAEPRDGEWRVAKFMQKNKESFAEIKRRRKRGQTARVHWKGKDAGLWLLLRTEETLRKIPDKSLKRHAQRYLAGPRPKRRSRVPSLRA